MSIKTLQLAAGNTDFGLEIFIFANEKATSESLKQIYDGSGCSKYIKHNSNKNKWKNIDQINSDLKGKQIVYLFTLPSLFFFFFAVKLRSSVATEQIFSYSLMNRFIPSSRSPSLLRSWRGNASIELRSAHRAIFSADHMTIKRGSAKENPIKSHAARSTTTK